jgi:Sulfotransferase family
LAEEPKVLYVLATGRSGSTLVDIVLGNHPDVESVGEFGYYLRPGRAAGSARGGWHEEQYCGCGERVNDCPFWSRVRHEWGERVGTGDVVGRYSELQEHYERYRRLPSMMLRERRRPSARFREYIEYNRALFETICEVSGKPVVVDSTKNLPRAFALSQTSGIELYVIHLVRDVRGVADSRRKDLQKDLRAGVAEHIEGWSVWYSTANWLAKNLLCEWFRRRALLPKRSIRLRYESFVRNPKGALDEIGDLMGLDMTELAEAVSAGEPLRVGHDIGGNRMRMSKDVRVRPDAGRWGSVLSAREQRMSWAVAGWLMRSYGYQK